MADRFGVTALGLHSSTRSRACAALALLGTLAETQSGRMCGLTWDGLAQPCLVCVCVRPLTPLKLARKVQICIFPS